MNPALWQTKNRRNLISPKKVASRFLAVVPPELTLRPWELKASAEDGAFMVPAAAALSRRYTEITCPVAIFAGAEDKFVKPEGQAARLHALIPGSTLSMVPGEGHMLHYGPDAIISNAVDRMVLTAASP